VPECPWAGSPCSRASAEVVPAWWPSSESGTVRRRALARTRPCLSVSGPWRTDTNGHRRPTTSSQSDAFLDVSAMAYTLRCHENVTQPRAMAACRRDTHIGTKTAMCPRWSRLSVAVYSGPLPRCLLPPRTQESPDRTSEASMPPQARSAGGSSGRLRCWMRWCPRLSTPLSAASAKSD
jgi:hypothetical protein